MWRKACLPTANATGCAVKGALRHLHQLHPCVSGIGDAGIYTSRPWIQIKEKARCMRDARVGGWEGGDGASGRGRESGRVALPLFKLPLTPYSPLSPSLCLPLPSPSTSTHTFTHTRTHTQTSTHTHTNGLFFPALPLSLAPE